MRQLYTLKIGRSKQRVLITRRENEEDMKKKGNEQEEPTVTRVLLRVVSSAPHLGGFEVPRFLFSIKEEEEEEEEDITISRDDA